MEASSYKVFEKHARTDITYKQPGESIFHFYDRSAQPYAVHVRARIEDWANLINADERPNLVASLKNDWDATFFELFLAKQFTDMGYNVQTHPKLEHTSKRPDFFLTGNGQDLIAEARVATDLSDDKRTLETVIERIVSGVNKNVKSLDVFLTVWDIKVLSQQTKSLRPLYKKLREYIDKNKAKAHTQEYLQSSGFRYHERFIYDDTHIRFECTLTPRISQEDYGPNDRIIGMQTSPARLIDSTAALKRAIEKKTSRYGKLNRPYVICVQVGSLFGASNSELDDLLFGDGIYNLNTKQSRRKHNGMFGSEDTPKLTRVSGVLFVKTNCINPDESSLRYFKNPNTEFPFDFGEGIETSTYDWKEVIITGGNAVTLDVNIDRIAPNSSVIFS